IIKATLSEQEIRLYDSSNNPLDQQTLDKDLNCEFKLENLNLKDAYAKIRLSFENVPGKLTIKTKNFNTTNNKASAEIEKLILIAGKFLDSNNNPVKNKEVKLFVKNKEATKTSRFNLTSKNYGEEILSDTTNELGRFNFIISPQDAENIKNAEFTVLGKFKEGIDNKFLNKISAPEEIHQSFQLHEDLNEIKFITLGGTGISATAQEDGKEINETELGEDRLVKIVVIKNDEKNENYYSVIEKDEDVQIEFFETKSSNKIQEIKTKDEKKKFKKINTMLKKPVWAKYDYKEIKKRAVDEYDTLTFYVDDENEINLSLNNYYDVAIISSNNDKDCKLGKTDKSDFYSLNNINKKDLFEINQKFEYIEKGKKGDFKITKDDLKNKFSIIVLKEAVRKVKIFVVEPSMKKEIIIPNEYDVVKYPEIIFLIEGKQKDVPVTFDVFKEKLEIKGTSTYEYVLYNTEDELKKFVGGDKISLDSKKLEILKKFNPINLDFLNKENKELLQNLLQNEHNLLLLKKREQTGVIINGKINKEVYEKIKNLNEAQIYLKGKDGAENEYTWKGSIDKSINSFRIILPLNINYPIKEATIFIEFEKNKYSSQIFNEINKGLTELGILNLEAIEIKDKKEEPESISAEHIGELLMQKGYDLNLTSVSTWESGGFCGHTVLRNILKHFSKGYFDNLVKALNDEKKFPKIEEVKKKIKD
ncbi:MAG: hypothetical protein PHG04_03355, partial [Candidatus Nanoarchaeia archaeon]|nr:hypothetical protein [Candidatus Nanoarchaeia archaeon]